VSQNDDMDEELKHTDHQDNSTKPTDGGSGNGDDGDHDVMPVNEFDL